MSEDKKDDVQSKDKPRDKESQDKDDDGLPPYDSDIDDYFQKIQFREHENTDNLNKSGLNKYFVGVSGVTDKIDSKK